MNNKFVIHEHHAVKAGLHYDLRLEKDNVLKSWASKKIPKLIDDPSLKIIIFQQPDHNISWFDFEGKIDDGYGKGNVIIWDTGTYDIIKWDITSHIIIDFHGNKIKGIYVILPYPNEKSTVFLMFKKKE